MRSLSSHFHKQVLTLDFHQSGTDGPLGWSADDRAGGHVELTAMAGASYNETIKLATRE